jgi:translation initiation factor 2D
MRKAHGTCSTAALYTAPELKALLAAYVADKQLVNARDQGFVDAGADNTLVTALGLGPDDEFLRREALLERLTARMQPWHEVGAVRRCALVCVRVCLG